MVGSLGCTSSGTTLYVTSIRWGGCLMEGVSMQRGVKQGDPISPLIFNAILDELLQSLPLQIGVNVNGWCITGIAYADDIMLYADSRASMQQLLRLVKFFGERSMMLNAGKCAAFSIQSAGHIKKMAVVDRPIFQVLCQDIKSVNIHQYLKYLGAEIGLGGVMCKTIESHLVSVQSIAKCLLHPQQNLEMLRVCILPTLGYALSLQLLSKGYLIRLDAMICGIVQKILHLPHYTPLGFFYAKCHEGGLGLKCMETLVPYLAIGHVDWVIKDDCMAIAELGNEDYLISVQRKYVAMLHPVQADKKMISDHWKQRWLGSMVGKGLEYMDRDKVSTQWLTYPVCNSRDYIDLVKMISQTLPCHGQRFRVDRKCHMGCPEQENFSYIAEMSWGPFSQIRCHIMMLSTLWSRH